MEQICTWLWRPEADGAQQEDAFFFVPPDGDAPAKILIARDGELPDDDEVAKLDTRPISAGGYQAVWMREMLRRKAYDALMPNMQTALDFLNARLGE